jgi:hypothetical protein
MARISVVLFLAKHLFCQGYVLSEHMRFDNLKMALRSSLDRTNFRHCRNVPLVI